MTQEELRIAARRQPFEPFRIILTTGATYDIRHPDLIMVGRRSATVGITQQPDKPVYDYTIKVDLLHIVGIEELPASPRHHRTGRRRDAQAMDVCARPTKFSNSVK